MTELLDRVGAAGRGLELTLHIDEDQRAEALRRRIHNPVCGLLRSMGFLIRERAGARMIIGSGDITGVHILNGQPPPRPGSFHLGGSGIAPFESRIRILAETLERYAGHSAMAGGLVPVHRATWQEVTAEGRPCLTREDLEVFTPEQFAQPGFPFAAFDPDAPIGWVTLPSLVDGVATLVPAQWFLLGYIPRVGEPWMGTAVTTGTAAHTDPPRALLSALEEVVQLDAAMGHWFGASRSIRIRHDRRTDLLRRMIDRQPDAFGLEPEFQLLPNVDLPGFNVACLLRQPPGLVPRVAIGLGSGADLLQAMYRSLLEAVAVQWLAAWLVIEERAAGASPEAPQAGRDLFNLEGNVGLAAGDEGSRAVEERFGRCDQADASDLPPDSTGDVRSKARALVDAFRRTGKRLYWGNLTTADISSLGFTVMRVWSPDTLSLSLPGAPESRHRRFERYGGFSHAVPHPYP
jgi:thiazole/oxazole-forming peptide maturase SagD family component